MGKDQGGLTAEGCAGGTCLAGDGNAAGGQRSPHAENGRARPVGWACKQPSPSGHSRCSLPRSLCVRPQSPMLVCEAELSEERVHSCKSGGSPAGILISPLTLGCSSGNARWTLWPLCALNMEVMEPHHAQSWFGVLSRQSHICALSSCPSGWLSGAKDPLMKEISLILTWSPVSTSLKTQALLKPGRAS